MSQAEVTAGAVPARRRTGLRFELTGPIFGTGLAVVLVALFLLVAAREAAHAADITQWHWDTAIAQLQNGLAQGAIYALIAIGYTMVYGIIELINFAHGDVFTLSGFYALLVGRYLGDLSSWVHDRATGVGTLNLASMGTEHGFGGFVLALIVVLPITMLLAGLTGMLIERVAYRRLRNSPRLAPLITAVGMSFVLEGIMFGKAGGANVEAESATWVTAAPVSVFGANLHIGSVNITQQFAVIIVVAVGLMLLLQLFVNSTKLGKAMRATAQDRDAALLCGININRTISLTFFIGSALAAAGAVMYGMYIKQIEWQDGFRIGIIAFTSAVLGGIGNIVGAGLGGFLIGMIAVFGGQLLNAQWSNSVVFAMLILVLTLRPVGLLGMRVPDRA